MAIPRQEVIDDVADRLAFAPKSAKTIQGELPYKISLRSVRYVLQMLCMGDVAIKTGGGHSTAYKLTASPAWGRAKQTNYNAGPVHS